MGDSASGSGGAGPGGGAQGQSLLKPLLLHGTCIAKAGQGVLLRGPSGAGKSDLALRCLHMPPRGADEAFQLVSDDQVLASRNGAHIVMRPPPTIAGKLEVRGVGIIDLDHCAKAPLRLVLDLIDNADTGNKVERLPEQGRKTTILGVQIALMALAPFEVSAPFKVNLLLEWAAMAQIK